MKTATRLLVASALCVPLLTGCANNEQTGTLVGVGGGALAGGLIGNALGGQQGALIGAALGGAAGGFAGSRIGADLDRRDRERAEMATRQALAAQQTNRPVTWNSAENQGVRGSATVTAVHRQPSGGECKTVREVAYIKGQEVTQNQRYCQGRDGSWVAAT